MRRVVFFGNASLGGRCVLPILWELMDLRAVIGPGIDELDVDANMWLYNFCLEKEIPLVMGSPNKPEVYSLLSRECPDIIWVTDYRYLLPKVILDIPQLLSVNLHPSLLPAYRGRAPENWALINGEKKLGITAHVIDEGMDTGDIIDQVSFTVEGHQDIRDVLTMETDKYDLLSRRLIKIFSGGDVPRRPQPSEGASKYPARSPDDGVIDWAMTAVEVHNLVRAVTRPYPGAFTYLPDGRKLWVWKTRLESSGTADAGCVLENGKEGMLVSCGQGAVRLLEVETTDDTPLDLGAHIRLNSVKPNPVPHNRLTYGSEEVDKVSVVVGSGCWAGGCGVAALEERFAQLFKTSNAVCLGSGFGALKLTLAGFGVESGTTVGVPAFSCVALANAPLSLGAKPRPLEVIPNCLTVDPCDPTICQTDVAVAVHTFGMPAPIRDLLNSSSIVVEDASHGFPLDLSGMPAAPTSKAMIMSLAASKFIGGAEGGVLLTDDDELADVVRDLRNYVDKAPSPLRTNQKLSDIEAALVDAQLDRLSDMIVQRAARAAFYRNAMAELAGDGAVVLPPQDVCRVWYRFVVYCPKHPATQVVKRLRARGIHAAQPFPPWANPGLRVSDQAFAHSVSLPLYPSLTKSEQNRVVRALQFVLAHPA
jgi:methionyl-tRNA formyltransferase